MELRYLYEIYIAKYNLTTREKDVSWIVEQALEEYFATVQKQLLEKNLADENAMTNLDFDEFWDGVDI